MTVASECARLVSGAPRCPLGLVELYATCSCQGTRYPPCQQGVPQLALLGDFRVSAYKRTGCFPTRSNGMRLTYSLRAGSIGGLKAPTAHHARRTLQQTCSATVKQADKDSIQLKYTPTNISAIDQEQIHLPQVLICNSQTLAAEVNIASELMTRSLHLLHAPFVCLQLPLQEAAGHLLQMSSITRVLAKLVQCLHALHA